MIDTIAGRGFGDHVPAFEADLRGPAGMAVDGQGNLYIADNFNARIRRVDTRGIITTVAGNGELGYSGDGGPAVQAQLLLPHDVAVDGAGNLYIADTNNNRIRRVDTRGIITTFAGTGDPGVTSGGYSGDGGPAGQAQLNGPTGVAVDRAGNVYIGDTQNNRVRRVDRRGIITTFAGTGPASPPEETVARQAGPIFGTLEAWYLTT